MSVNHSRVAVHMHHAYACAMARNAAPQQTAEAATDPAEWLDAEMRRRGIDQVELQRASKVPQPTISKILSGKQRASDLVLKRLAAGMKTAVPPAVLAATIKGRNRRGGADEVVLAALASAVTGARPTRPGFDVPIWHALIIGRGPSFLLQPAPTEFAWRPPALSAARSAFVLHMPDDSMIPWRAAGEPIYFDPKADVGTATHAILQFDMGQPTATSLICRLLAPPIVGQPVKARIYRDGRRSSVPTEPVVRVVPAVEWPLIIPR